MPWGRFFASCAASVAVAGGAVVVIGMSQAADKTAAAPRKSPTPVVTSRPATPAGASDSAGPQQAATATPIAPTSTPASRTTPTPRGTAHPAVVRPVATTSVAPPPPVRRAARPTVPPVVTHAAARKPVHQASTAPKPKAPAKPRGRALPLHFSTGSATRVITVVGHSAGGTTARLQAWNKVSNGHWLPYGKSVTAHIGSDGMSRHASESRSATPIGSFTLTQAFGHNSNPGTHLHYVHTNGNDWWISQPGRLYNTHQRCGSGCHFNRGSPNEHLYYETPYYNYATVIDYNTRNAPGGVRQGRGSAFFLHVTDGAPTAGCVAIPQSKLITIMRWLTPSAHPRILIGVS